jgi:hypothetical protein
MNGFGDLATYSEDGYKKEYVFFHVVILSSNWVPNIHDLYYFSFGFEKQKLVE